MKKILYIITLCLVLFACKKEQEVYNLNLSFKSTVLDAGESTQIIDIPLVLTGAKKTQRVDVTVDVIATENTAKDKVDFEILTPQVTFNYCGVQMVKVKLIDNEEIQSEKKDFTVSIVKTDKENVIFKNKSALVNILNEDYKAYSIEGKYTLHVTDRNGVDYSSEEGVVTITQDNDNKNIYHIANLQVKNGKGEVSPLTQKGVGLKLERNHKGEYIMPTQQATGLTYKGYTEGIIVAVTPSYGISGEPFRFMVKQHKDIYMMSENYFVALGENRQNKQPTPFYIYKDLWLERVNK